MNNKIDGVSGQHQQVGGASQNAKTARESPADSRAAQSTPDPDQFNLSSSGQLLKDLNARVQASEGFDQQKVDAIKRAIAEGSYKVDASRIADALQQLEDQL